LSDIE